MEGLSTEEWRKTASKGDAVGSWKRENTLASPQLPPGQVSASVFWEGAICLEAKWQRKLGNIVARTQCRARRAGGLGAKQTTNLQSPF